MSRAKRCGLGKIKGHRKIRSSCGCCTGAHSKDVHQSHGHGAYARVHGSKKRAQATGQPYMIPWTSKYTYGKGKPVTYDMVMAMGQDAANANMRKHGRTAWNRDDLNEAIKVTDKLFGPSHIVKNERPSQREVDKHLQKFGELKSKYLFQITPEEHHELAQEEVWLKQHGESQYIRGGSRLNERLQRHGITPREWDYQTERFVPVGHTTPAPGPVGVRHRT